MIAGRYHAAPHIPLGVQLLKHFLSRGGYQLYNPRNNSAGGAIYHLLCSEPRAHSELPLVSVVSDVNFLQVDIYRWQLLQSLELKFGSRGLATIKERHSKLSC